MRRIVSACALLAACTSLVTAVDVEKQRTECSNACEQAAPAALVGQARGGDPCTFASDCAPACCACQFGVVFAAACVAGQCKVDEVCSDEKVGRACAELVAECVLTDGGDVEDMDAAVQPFDAGRRDSGVRDAGTVRDSGVSPVDAGAGRDAGMLPDASISVDAAVPVDAGPAFPVDGLLMAWHFDGTLVDSSGHMHDLVGVGGYRPGHVDGALAGGTEVALPDAMQVDFSAGDFTIAGWFFVDSVQDGESVVLLSKGYTDTLGFNQQGWRMWRGFDGQLWWCTGSGPQFSCEQRHPSASSNVPFPSDGWHHAAVRQQSGVVTIFVDGRAAGMVSSAPPPSSTSTSLFVGWSAGGSQVGQTLEGGIDEVRMYGRALSDDEVAALAAQDMPRCVDDDGRVACNLLLRVDARHAESAMPNSQRWVNLVKNASPHEDDLTLGLSDASDSTDPVLEMASQRWRLDGSSFFSRAPTGSFIETMHDQSSFTVEIVADVFADGVLMATALPPAPYSGLVLDVAGGRLRLTLVSSGNGSIHVTEFVASEQVSPGAHVYAVSWERSLSTGLLAIDGVPLSVNGAPAGPFGADLPTSLTPDPAYGLGIGALPDGSQALPLFSFLFSVNVYDRALTLAELASNVPALLP